MYKARHAKNERRRLTLPMLLAIAALCVAILVFPTSATDSGSELDAVSGARSAMSANLGAGTCSVLPSAGHGGAVSASVSDAVAGDLVTFSVKPQDGFETSSVSVVTASGESVQVVRVNGDSFKFVMPAQGVIIDAVFQYARTA